MPRKKIKMVEGVGYVSMTYALDEFMRHCKRRNLSPVTMKDYEEDINYFQKVMQLDNTSEICKEILDSFVDHEMNTVPRYMKYISVWAWLDLLATCSTVDYSLKIFEVCT